MPMSVNCKMLGKLSMGYTVEQQADGLAAALAAGYQESDIASMFLPIWEYQIGHYEERLREYIRFVPAGSPAEVSRMEETGYNYKVASDNVGMQDWAVTPTVYGAPANVGYVPDAVMRIGDQNYNNNRVDSVVHPRLMLTPVKQVQGPNSIFAFIMDYNAAQDKGNRGAKNVIADIMEYLKYNWRDAPLIMAAGVWRPAGTMWHHYYWHAAPGEGTIIQYTPCSIIAQQIITKVYGSKSSIKPFAEDWGPQSIDPVTQTDLIRHTRCVMGIEHWDFTHVDGTTKRVGAFVCPLPEPVTGDIPPANSLTFYEDTAEMVCDYTPYELPPIPSPKPYPYDWGQLPDGGEGGVMLLIDAKPAPIYPQYKGFLTYDTAIKKWGKAKMNYTQLLDLSPVNTNQGKIVTTNRFGMEAASYALDNKFYRFDSAPAQSYIKYGKIGMHRLGFTTLEEVRITFRFPVTGEIIVSSSLDGRNPEAGLTKRDAYTDATWYNMGVGAAGKWHTIIIKGNYDITHLEYVGLAQGRR